MTNKSKLDRLHLVSTPLHIQISDILFELEMDRLGHGPAVNEIYELVYKLVKEVRWKEFDRGWTGSEYRYQKILKDERKRVVEIIKGSKKRSYIRTADMTPPNYEDGKYEGYNHAIDDILEKLKEE